MPSSQPGRAGVTEHTHTVWDDARLVPEQTTHLPDAQHELPVHLHRAVAIASGRVLLLVKRAGERVGADV